MTKEEAIKYLQQLYPNGGHCWLDEQRIEAIGMAVRALQEEPKFKTGDRIKPIDSCLGSPRTIVDICDSWYVTDQGTLDFEYEDNWELVEEPVSEELETELNKYIKNHFTIDTEQLDRFGIEEKDYMYSMDKSDMLALVEHFTNWQKQKDSIVSEELEVASKKWLIPQLDKSYANYGYAKMMELTHFDGYAMLDAIEFGAKWQKKQDQFTIELAEDHAMLAGMEKMKEQMTKDIWKPADGEDLPEYEREVVVLTQPYLLENSEFAVSFAHRPNPDGWDGKSVTTGEIEHYIPKTYDKGGWNIPNVKWWLDCNMDSILKRNDENNKIGKR